MKDKLCQWIVVIVLGVVLPSVALGFALRKETVTNETPAIQQSSSDSIKLLMPDGSVADMELEDYVLGVVLAEMPAQFETEALKAQSVLARTYVKKRAMTQYKHAQAPVCTDPSCCQGFVKEAEYSGESSLLLKVKAAVNSTKGQVLTYNGELIDATYFSCSGGRTEDALAVWGTDVPYLQATDSPGEEKSLQYLSTVTLDQAVCAEKLGLKQKISIDNVAYTDGGGVKEIYICGKRYTGLELRQLLDLKSTAFQMNVVGSNVIITVRGYGHRVGMSQYGADAMASQGCTYEQILAHYYKDTVLEKVFP